MGNLDNLAGIESDVRFDFESASTAIIRIRSAANRLENGSGARASAVSTGAEEFRGFFSEIFDSNAQVASVDAQNIVNRLRESADSIGNLRDAARAEQQRRERAREHMAMLDNRSGWDRFVDWAFTGPPEFPEAQIDPIVSPPLSAALTPRDHPTDGAGGTGTSSAVPQNLYDFASALRGNTESTREAKTSAQGAYNEFRSGCHWGDVDAVGVFTAFTNWLDANDQDTDWATTVGEAFEAAGGSGTVSTVSDAALYAALQNAGIDAFRDSFDVPAPGMIGGEQTTGYVNDPVNSATGNFIEPEIDLSLTDIGSDLTLRRMYNSVDPNIGSFGLGWSSDADMELRLSDDGADCRLWDGRELHFPREGAGWSRCATGNFWLAEEPVNSLPISLTSVTGAGRALVVRGNDGQWWAFSQSGRWLGNGSSPHDYVAARRDESGRLTGIDDSRGTSVDFEWSGGLIVVAIAADGRRAQYEYDGNRLESVATPLGIRRYEYNDEGLIERVISAVGEVEVVNTYDAASRVIRQESPFGRITRFAYLPGRVTVVSDEDGSRSNTWIADAKGRLIGVIDGEGNRQSMSYDPRGNLVSVTERDGRVTVHLYDDRGRRTRTVTPEGADFTFGYDDSDRITTLVTDSGSIVTYEYADDSNRHPARITDPVGGRTSLTWSDGLLTELTDPAGVWMRFGYDERGRLTSTKNAAGHVATLERDHAGRITAAVSPMGARHEFGHDEETGLPTWRRDPMGATWRFEYDDAGRRVRTIDPLGAVFGVEYGPENSIAATIDPLGRTARQIFDDLGAVIASELPDGSRWEFGYDMLSRLTETVDPDGGRWTREYDANGALARVTDPTGVSQRHSVDRDARILETESAHGSTSVNYDEYGRPTSRTSLTDSHEIIAYDACGRPVEIVDGEGGLTRFVRDLSGKVIERVDPGGHSTRYRYNELGKLVEATTATGTTTLEYDPDGRLVRRVLPSGDVEYREYDAAGRIVRRNLPGGAVSRYRYDKASRLVWSQDAVSGTRRFAYDAAGQLIRVTNGLGGVTDFEYDDRGRLITIVDPLGNTTRRTYTQLNQVSSITDAAGQVTEARYDAAGRIVWQREPDGRVFSWEYDEDGRKRAELVNGRYRTEIIRDLRANAVTLIDHSRHGAPTEHHLVWNRRNQLTAHRRGDQTTEWRYNADGTRAAMTTSDGSTVSYTYTDTGLLSSVAHPQLGTVTFEYDSSGRMVAANAGPIMQSWAYHQGLISEYRVRNGDDEKSTRFEYEGGHISRVHRDSGTSISYDYDGANQLVSMTTATLTADGVTESQETFNYDVAGRMVRHVDSSGGETAHSYNALAQLTETRSERATTRYSYDPSGRRVSRVGSDGTSTFYDWDEAGWLSAIRAQSGGDESRTALHVDGLGSLASVDAAEVWWDLASHVPALIGIGGTAVVGTPSGLSGVSHDWLEPAWRSTHGSDLHNPWAQQSAEIDGLPSGVELSPSAGLSIDGLEWLGRRVYDPTSFSFLSRDPMPSILGAGWSGSPYSYAGNNPVAFVDPLGLSPVTEAQLHAHMEANQSMMSRAGDFIADNWVEILGGLAIVVATATMGPVGAALTAAAISGVANATQQVINGGEFSWGELAVTTIAGGAGGLIGGRVAGMMAGKRPLAHWAAGVATDTGINGTASLLLTDWPWTLGDVASAYGSAAATSALTNSVSLGVQAYQNTGPYASTPPSSSSGTTPVSESGAVDFDPSSTSTQTLDTVAPTPQTTPADDLVTLVTDDNRPTFSGNRPEPFPSDWSEAVIEHAASDVATGPAPWNPVDGGYNVHDTYNGVDVTVEIRGDEITGAYPR